MGGFEGKFERTRREVREQVFLVIIAIGVDAIEVLLAMTRLFQ